jgi:penicillin amidase
MESKSVDEALAIGELMKTAGQNLTAADVDGNIGWKATGLVPIRKGYSGRAPADGSDPEVGWDGFGPYEKMPFLKNPSVGHIATANNKTIHEDAEHSITYSWLASYRHDRIVSLIESSNENTVGRMAEIQMDVHSLQGERLIPGLLAYEFSDPNAHLAAGILRDWDLQVVPDSIGAAVFSVFLNELKRLLAEPIAGEYLPLFLSISGFFYTPVDVLLTGGRPNRLLAAAGYTGENAAGSVCEEALRRTVSFLRNLLGSRSAAWKWGELHTYHYEHPGATNRLMKFLLNRGPYPAYGNSTTVNVSAFDSSRAGDARAKYQTMTIASMRLVTSMHDMDSTLIIAPMGQSGKPGNRHYDDMIDRWITGDRVPLPLSRGGAEAVATKKLILRR